jgi:hypothetical protein
MLESIDGFILRTTVVGGNTAYRHQTVNPPMAEAGMVITGDDVIGVATDEAPNPLILDHPIRDIVKTMDMTKWIGLELLL